MKNVIEVGSIVRLKSGGPWMTVGIVSGTACTCQWFTSNNEYQEAKFYTNCLVPRSDS